MQKRDFETYQKRFRDFEILPTFSDTHVFRGTIHHPLRFILDQFFSYNSGTFSVTLNFFWTFNSIPK